LPALLVERHVAAERTARQLGAQRQARAAPRIERIVGAVAQETEREARRREALAELDALECGAIRRGQRAERVDLDAFGLVGDRPAGEVGPRQRPADADRAADAALRVVGGRRAGVAILPGIEEGKSEQRRRVAEPRLGEAEVVVLALAAPLEMELEGLAV